MVSPAPNFPRTSWRYREAGHWSVNPPSEEPLTPCSGLWWPSLQAALTTGAPAFTPFLACPVTSLIPREQTHLTEKRQSILNILLMEDINWCPCAFPQCWSRSGEQGWGEGKPVLPGSHQQPSPQVDVGEESTLLSLANEKFGCYYFLKR